MKKISKDMSLLEENDKNIVLFYPHIPKRAIEMVTETLKTRWIGQGPKVTIFETKFRKKFCGNHGTIAVGSGTDALHLAYLLAGIKSGDEVIAPVFTCTATNIPLLYIGAKIKFADVEKDTLNIDTQHVANLINEKTKAIICVHYGGFPCDMDALQSIAASYGIPIIEDAAHALGASYKGKKIGSISEFTMFSFQAIKHITTGDGGMLSFKDIRLKPKAERMRWFGIDRIGKQKAIWDNDIKEIGYKYQMTDISAAMGLAALEEFDSILKLRKSLLAVYKKYLHDIPGIKIVGADYKDRTHAAWLCTVIAENRYNLQLKLREHNIESNQVHYRNDRYTIFGKRCKTLHNMDEIEHKYLVLPLHTKMSVDDVVKICKIIKSGW
jgi:dTDP-4-amino-4,6-dideoxygalactose transaminase